MSQDLRRNTAVVISVGPFVDKTDGITPETTLTVTNCHLTMTVDTDDGNAPTLVIDANATASGGNNDMVHITGDDAGMYSLELTAAQTNYVGRATLVITDAANHCPVIHRFNILTAVEFDAKYGTGARPANVQQWKDTTVPTPATAGYPAVTLKVGTGTGEVNLNAGVVPANLVNLNGNTSTFANLDAFFSGAGYAGGTIKLQVQAVQLGSAQINSSDTIYFPEGKLAAQSDIPTAGNVATAVWSAVTRTLTANTNLGLPASWPANWLPATLLGANAPANWINAAAIANTALNGKGDWLLAASYPGSALDYTNERVDALVSLFATMAPDGVYTEAALANAPTGDAGGGASWDDLLADHLLSGSFGAAINTILNSAAASAGTGARTVTLTVTDGTDPLQGARVRVTQGAETYVLSTAADGTATFGLDDATWAVTITKSGYTFTPTTLAVSADASQTYAMAALSITPSDPGMATGYLVCYDADGVPAAAQTVHLRIVAPPVDGTGAALDDSTVTGTSDVNGLVSFPNLIAGSGFQVKYGNGQWSKRGTVPPSVTTFAIPDVLGH